MLSGPPLPPPRPRETHKGAMGRALLVGGSRGMAGAMHLATGGALRAGPGYVIAAVPAELAAGVHLAHPEVLVPPVGEHLNLSALPVLRDLVRSADALAIGPGLGMAPGTAELLLKLLRELARTRAGFPCVLDADALNLLAAAARETGFAWSELAALELLITPHPGEAARILAASESNVDTGVDTGVDTEVEAGVEAGAAASTGAPLGQDSVARRACWQQLVETTEACVLLKGAGTLIGDRQTLCERNEGPFLNPTGNPGMATAGAGDVLTGILVGLLARGMNCLAAARLGAWLHGCAGDLAAQAGSPESMCASDLVNFLPLAWRDLAHRAPTT